MTPSPNVIAGQTYPAQPLPANFKPESSALDTPGIEQNELLIAQTQAYLQNQNLAYNYINGTFGSWKINLEAGKIPINSQPPQPPAGFQVIPTGGDAQTVGGFVFVQNGPPVCAIPSYTPPPGIQAPATPTPQVYPVGSTVQNTLGIAAGSDINMPDGSQWLAIARATPFGTVQLLQRIV